MFVYLYTSILWKKLTKSIINCIIYTRPLTLLLEGLGMTPITEREKARTLEFIQQNSTDNTLLNPLPCLADLLLTIFGWPISAGKKRASAILKELERSGEITCQTNGHKSVKVVNLALQPIEQKVEKEKKIQPPDTTDVKAGKPKSTSSKKFCPKIKKGLARIRREAEEKGERNERRFHVLMDKLLELLNRNFSSIVIGATNFRSGRHNPKKNRIDIQDHNGEDVTPKLTVRQSDGRIFEGRIIYNSKSSYPAVQAFNRKIIYHPGQEGALLKKAIRVTPRSSDRNIVSEVVDDMISVKLLPAEIKESVLSNFSEY